MRDEWKKFEGQVLNNKFPLQKLLGSTSYSAVFLTQSPPPDRKNIAIKLMTSGAKADCQAALLQRASKLSHPNLLRVLPGGRCQLADMDLVFVFMEYAEEDLGRGLSDHPLSEKAAREMLEPLLGAINYIHSKGFAHSHIKPSNIRTVGNQLKLTSDTVLPLGEPRPAYRPVDAYDAPEAASAPVAGAIDIWSLGVTLVEVFTQHAPVSSPESQADPIVPSTIPLPFLDIARNCLRRDPLERWSTAQIADYLNPAPVQVAAPAVNASAEEEREPAKEMWVDSDYCWVVVCKNDLFHRHPNIFNVHRIPLGETDAVSPRPSIGKPFAVRCDECHKEYMYQPPEVLRYEMEVPASFVAHPLFCESPETDKNESTGSPQPTPRNRFVRTLEWVAGVACLTLIVAEFALTNLPKLSADVSGPSHPNDPGAMFSLDNKGLLPVYDVKAGCEVMRVEIPSLKNTDFGEPTMVYFAESHAEILSPGHEMTVPCGRAIAIKPGNMEAPEIHAEMFFVVTYRPKGVWWHKSEKFPMEAKKTENGMWIWKSIRR
jgi:serine/threonine protein kinase